MFGWIMCVLLSSMIVLDACAVLLLQLDLFLLFQKCHIELFLISLPSLLNLSYTFRLKDLKFIYIMRDRDLFVALCLHFLRFFSDSFCVH